MYLPYFAAMVRVRGNIAFDILILKCNDLCKVNSNAVISAFEDIFVLNNFQFLTYCIRFKHKSCCNTKTVGSG